MGYRWLKLSFGFILLFSILMSNSWGLCFFNLFKRNHPHTTESLMAVGDLNFTGDFGRRIVANPDYPWVHVRQIIDQATVLMGNLEVPLTTHDEPYTKKSWILKADPRTVQALVSGGFDLVTLANNHIMDYGPRSLEETLKSLRQAGIKSTGAGSSQNEARKPALIKTPSGVNLAFLSYSTTYPDLFWATSSRPGTAYGKPANFLTDIKAAKAVADHVIVSFHWSQELQVAPTNYQIQYAHQCIDAGASLVIGHHPHVLQGLEVYHAGLIAYSLGNFAFGSLTRKVNDSAILAVEFTKSGLIQAKLHPVNVQNYQVLYQPRPLTGNDANRVLQTLRTLCTPFNTPLELNNDMGVIQIK